MNLKIQPSVEIISFQLKTSKVHLELDRPHMAKMLSDCLLELSTTAVFSPAKMNHTPRKKTQQGSIQMG